MLLAWQNKSSEPSSGLMNPKPGRAQDLGQDWEREEGRSGKEEKGGERGEKGEKEESGKETWAPGRNGKGEGRRVREGGMTRYRGETSRVPPSRFPFETVTASASSAIARTCLATLAAGASVAAGASALGAAGARTPATTALTPRRPAATMTSEASRGPVPPYVRALDTMATLSMRASKFRAQTLTCRVLVAGYCSVCLLACLPSPRASIHATTHGARNLSTRRRASCTETPKAGADFQKGARCAAFSTSSALDACSARRRAPSPATPKAGTGIQNVALAPELSH